MQAAIQIPIGNQVRIGQVEILLDCAASARGFGDERHHLIESSWFYVIANVGWDKVNDAGN